MATGDIFGTAISGLLSFQRAMTTTSHNIANVNTPGYSRQRVDFATRPPFPTGSGFLGNGVETTGVQRSYNQFLSNQVSILLIGGSNAKDLPVTCNKR